VEALAVLTKPCKDIEGQLRRSEGDR